VSEIDTILQDFVAAYLAAYPGKEPPEVRAVNGAYQVAGQTMSAAEVRMASSKLKANAGISPFTRASESEEDRARLIDAIKSGNKGNLTIGEILHKRLERGSSLATLEAWLLTQGLALPSKGTRSKYVNAYQAWVRNAGLNVGELYEHSSFADDAGNPIAMTLEGVSTYNLYELRNMVTKSNAIELLAMAYSNTQEELQALAKDANAEREPSEPMRSIKVPKSIIDRLKQVSERMPGKSSTEVLAFFIEFMYDFSERDPEQFDTLVLSYWGDDVPQANQEA